MKRDEICNPDNGKRMNIFWRAALGLAYLYLNFAAYQLVGIAGVALTSGFFLVAQFSPIILRTFDRRRKIQVASGSKVIEPGIENSDTGMIPVRLVSQTEQKGL